MSSVVVDAGAHVGLFTIYASRKAKKVIAIEPNPKNYSLLELNIKRNNLKNVKAIKKALWYEKTTLNLETSRWSAGHKIAREGES
ncbi:MAG: FkbM family methyltransferase [Archaeoglobaceae archaeon]|nr:FkbM family methyltransferase [Archaeoglobaceae archaeon]